MRILSLDVGTKRIGVAKGDPEVKIAVPVGTIEVDGNEFQEIARLTRLYNVNVIVLGLPRSNEGNETEQSLYVRKFAHALAQKLPEIRIRFQDESLTSVVAEERLRARKKNFKKGEIDTEAATIIMQDFLDNYKNIETAAPKDTNLIEKNVEKMKLGTKKVKHHSKKLIGLLIVPPFLLLLIILGVGGFLWYRSMLGGVTPECDQTDYCTSFEVTSNETVSTIADHLEEKKLIKNAFALKIYLKLERSNAQLKAGTYYFDEREYTATDIIDILEAGVRDENVFTFTILPGETIFDVKKKLMDLGYLAEDIDAALKKDYDNPVLAGRPSGASLEGYLFGDTHEFYKGEKIENILSAFISGLETVVNENGLEEKFKAQGLSLYEGIVLASVVQKESGSADAPTVAQVFLSRLSSGIPLGSDVTVSYALDVVDPNRETYKDNQAALQIDSCYNTRRNAGLPCGPISSPGLAALKAVGEPSDTSYLYFLTGDDGAMYYSYTEAEHNQKIYTYCKVLCNVAL